MPDIVVNGCNIHYEVDDFTDPWREADTIWIQHGFGRSSKFWYHWVPPLAGQYRVIRRDMRGHGQSGDPGPDYQMTLESVLDDMLGFLDALGLDKVHYVGESSGGLFGMAFAAKHSDRLRSLTLCSSPTTVPKATIDSQMPPGQASQKAALADMPIADYVRSNVDRRLLSVLSPEHLDWIISEWQKNHRHVMIDLGRLLDAVDLSDQLAKINVPTLVLAPTQSPLAPLELQRKSAEMIPNAELVEITGIGHEIYVDQADACIAALKAFLSRING